MNDFLKPNQNNIYNPNNKISTNDTPMTKTPTKIDGEFKKSLNMQNKANEILNNKKTFKRNVELNDIAKKENLDTKFHS